MIEKLAFITALGAAVIAIDATDWATWAAAHGGDTYFKMIEARLVILMKYYNQATIDDLCQYLVTNTLVPSPQSVPSALFWPYKLNACFSSPAGVIRKRVPDHVVKSGSGPRKGAPGSWRWGTNEIFIKACDCLKLQPATGGEDDKFDGPMGRDKWYAEAGPSGLFWTRYFMQTTLDYMYGPSKPNTWPFTFSDPPWCMTIPPVHYQWRLHAYGLEGSASLNVIYFPPTGASFGSGLSIRIKLAPDPSRGDPGNMAIGYLHSSHASMNEDYEVLGEYSESDLTPLPAFFTEWPIVCTQYDADPWLYQELQFLEMAGDYFIDFYVSSSPQPDSIYSEQIGGVWNY